MPVVPWPTATVVWRREADAIEVSFLTRQLKRIAGSKIEIDLPLAHLEFGQCERDAETENKLSGHRAKLSRHLIKRHPPLGNWSQASEPPPPPAGAAPMPALTNPAFNLPTPMANAGDPGQKGKLESRYPW